MIQGKGYIYLSGGQDSYNQDLEKIRNKANVYEMYYWIYSVSMRAMTGDALTTGTLTVGNWTSTDQYSTGKYYDNSTKKFRISDIFQKFQTYGIDSLKPLKFDTIWKYGANVNYNIKLISKIETTVSDIAISSTVPKADIVVTWNSTNQDKYEVEAYTGGSVIYRGKGKQEKTHTIPANTFADGQKILLAVAVYYTENDTLTENSWSQEKAEYTLKNPNSKLSNFKPTGILNALAPIEVTWDSALQESYKLDIYSDNKLIKTYTGGKEKALQIPANTLYDGNIEFRLSISDGYTTLEHSEICTITNNPKIKVLGLEPSNSVRNRSFPIDISWTVVNQRSWQLQILENGVLKGQFDGTTESNLKLPADFLEVGTITLILTAFNTVYDELVQDTKQVTFTTISRPKKPIWEDKSNFNIAKPILRWIPDGIQIAYQMQIYKSDVLIEDSNIVELQAPTYAVKTSLKNNTTYIIKVKTKNNNQLWSDYAEKQIYISYTQLSPATFSITPNHANGSVLINFSSAINTNFKENQIWKDDNGVFKLVALNLGANGTFIDYYVAGNKNISYKIISKAKNDAITESDIKVTKINVNGFILANAEDTQKNVRLKFNYSAGFETIKNRQFIKYLGSKKPIIEDDGSTSYQKGQFTFDMPLNDYYMLENLYHNDKTLFYRDNRGKALFCAINNLITEYHFRIPTWIKVSFELIEVENQIEVYESGSGDRILKEVLIDGTWILNGEKDLTGWEWVTE